MDVDWIKDLPWSERDRCSRKAHDALNKFNRNLLLKLEDIIETDLKEIVIFLLNIEKYDRLNREKKVAAKKNKEKEKEKTGNKRKDKMDTSFLEYDLDRYNSKKADQKRRTVVEGALNLYYWDKLPYMQTFQWYIVTFMKQKVLHIWYFSSKSLSYFSSKSYFYFSVLLFLLN